MSLIDAFKAFVFSSLLLLALPGKAQTNLRYHHQSIDSLTQLIAGTNDTAVLIHLYVTRERHHLELGQHAKVLEDIHQMQRLNTGLNDSSIAAQIHIEHINLNLRLHDMEVATTVGNQLKILLPYITDTVIKIEALFTMSFHYLQLQPDSASYLQCLKEVKPLVLAYGDCNLLGDFYHRTATSKLHFTLEYDSSLYYEQLSAQVIHRCPTATSVQLVDAEMNLFFGFDGIGEPDSALAHLGNARDLLLPLGDNFKLFIVYKYMTLIYEETGRKDSAYAALMQQLEHYKRYFRDNEAQIVDQAQLEMDMQLQLYKDSIQDAIVLKEQAAVVAAEKAQNNYLMIMVAILLLTAIALVIAYRKIRKDKQLIALRNEEKEVLLKEIHHRVKNNLQVISGLLQLQSNRSNDPEVKAIMAEGQNRIQSMALVHKMLYQNTSFSTLPFTEYLQKLTNHILSGYQQEQVALTIAPSTIVLSVDHAIPLGLITNELVTNAMKYAFPNRKGNIDICMCQVSPHQYELEIKDNGIGLPAHVEVEKAKTTGLRLVGVLVEQIQATFEVTRSGGTTYKIAFQQHG